MNISYSVWTFSQCVVLHEWVELRALTSSTRTRDERRRWRQTDRTWRYIHWNLLRVRLSTFHGNNTWQIKNFMASYPPQCISYDLRERRLTFAGHCYRCEDQPVKHLVFWEGRAGRMLRGQANRLTYLRELLRDSCCETVDELQRMMKNRAERARVSHTTSSSKWLRSLRSGLMDGSDGRKTAFYGWPPRQNYMQYNTEHDLMANMKPRCNCANVTVTTRIGPWRNNT